MKKQQFLDVASFLQSSTKQQVAISANGKEETYQELDQIVEELASRLHQVGVKPSSRIAIIAGFNKETIHAILAVLRLHAVAVLISPSLTNEGIDYALDVTETDKILVCNQTLTTDLTRYQNVYTTIQTMYQQLPNACKRFQEDDFTEGESGMILFTSGSTSHPKAVFLSQDQLLQNALVHRDFLNVKESDRILVSVPFDHILGSIVTLFTPFVSHATICIPENRHTDTLLKCIEENHVSLICGVPTMYHSLLCTQRKKNYDLSSLRVGITGGAYCRKDLYQEIEEVFNMQLYSTLGQTETCGGYTIHDLSENEELRKQTVGFASPLTKICLVDCEICVKTPLLSSGYVNKNTTVKLEDSDGWFHTGDLGEIDEHGYLHVIGRKKDIIIRGGENISCLEMEGVFEKMPGIKECKIIGVPDEHRGEEVCACLIGENVNEEDVKAFAKEHFETFKIPRYILFFDSFPKSDLGKIHRKSLLANVLKRLNLLEDMPFER